MDAYYYVILVIASLWAKYSTGFISSKEILRNVR